MRGTPGYCKVIVAVATIGSVGLSGCGTTTVATRAATTQTVLSSVATTVAAGSLSFKGDATPDINVPITDPVQPGGDFADQPADPHGPLTEAQAVQAARETGATGAPTAATAAATVDVLSYSRFLELLGQPQTDHQLGPNNRVVLTEVNAAYTANDVPSPPGEGVGKPWVGYAVATDPRTALTLWFGPLTALHAVG
jgi:hypothetical protein